MKNKFLILSIFIGAIVIGSGIFFINRRDFLQGKEEQCSAKSKEFFNQFKIESGSYGSKTTQGDQPSYDYTNHYNEKYQGCFIYIKTLSFQGNNTDNSVITNTSLINVYENNEIMFSITEEINGIASTNPLFNTYVSRIKTRDGKNITKDEFNLLVKSYMEK